MEKILFVATVEEHILSFHIPVLKWFYDNGHEVHVATNGSSIIPYVAKHHTISITRSPFRISNLKACRELKKIIEKNRYMLVHAHTPMGGICARIACQKARKKQGTFMIYTAHGFHFYKGAPLRNWLLYFPAEWLLSYKTDCLITMNREDFQRAKKCLHPKRIEFVHGVGLNAKRFYKNEPDETYKKRKEIGVHQDDFLLIYVAELIIRKNQEMALRIVKALATHGINCKLALVGTGEKRELYENMAREMGLQEQVIFLGWRSDVGELLQCADIYISTSRAEGLPVNILEAMFMGLPIITTDIRGHRDLIRDGENGFLVKIGDVEKGAEYILELCKTPEKRKRVGNAARDGMRSFMVDRVIPEMARIYGTYMN